MFLRDNDEYINTDILVIGGGLGGCFAAVKAAEAGAKVVIFEKANILRSGQLGTGISSMQLIHPDYNYSFREFAKLNVEAASGIADEDVCYEFAKDTLDRILDLEKYGLKVRTDDGSFYFKTAPQVSAGKLTIRPPGPTDWRNMKPILSKKVVSHPNITVLNRTSAIGLLTREGAVGRGVVGGIGLGTRTGKFVICQAKAVILTTGDSNRLQRNYDSLYAPSRFVSCGPPTQCGEGLTMAYRAGADIINMEFSCGGSTANAWKDFAHDGVGQAMSEGQYRNAWGKIIPNTVDRYGLYLRTHPGAPDTEGPLYGDLSNLSGWPEEKGAFQRALWALENESTSTGFLLWMKERGEDFRKGPVEVGGKPLMHIHSNQAGIHMDVDARSSLEGLYCAGDLGAGGWRQSSGGAFVFGARAGRNAAEYAGKVPKAEINKEQVETEKKRILEALDVNPQDGYSWVELEDKVRKIATDYGPPFTNDPMLERGLMHLDRIKTRYLPKMYARDPREMMRVSEVKTVFTVVEAFLRAALFRKESRHMTTSILHKTEYPDRDDKNWLKHTVIRNVDGDMKLTTMNVKRLPK
jgi:succinate dehydrogenase/fumarate reductase flavoprotein subunit